MKLRIRGNTLRIRLSEMEADLLFEGKPVMDATCFPSAELAYIVQPSTLNSIDFVENTIQLNLDKVKINEWAKSEQVAISIEIATQSENILSILVEKDFKCLTVRPEDESGLFPNPNAPHG